MTRQTIARVNRVFPGKENGLIVDYVGVFRNIESTLAKHLLASSARPVWHLQPADDETRRPGNLRTAP